MIEEVKQLDLIEEFEEDEDEDEDEGGVYVLVKILESELGIGLSVPNDEPNGDYFMSVVDNLYRTSALQAIEGLIRSCERHERGVLAKEIRAFLETPTTLH